MYGPPGTGKTLLARAVASQLDANFLKVVSSAIVDKYIGESARLIREMFNYAKDHQPCIIFMDEIDAIGNNLIHFYSLSRSDFVGSLKALKTGLWTGLIFDPRIKSLVF